MTRKRVTVLSRMFKSNDGRPNKFLMLRLSKPKYIKTKIFVQYMRYVCGFSCESSLNDVSIILKEIFIIVLCVV